MLAQLWSTAQAPIWRATMRSKRFKFEMRTLLCSCQLIALEAHIEVSVANMLLRAAVLVLHGTIVPGQLAKKIQPIGGCAIL